MAETDPQIGPISPMVMNRVELCGVIASDPKFGYSTNDGKPYLNLMLRLYEVHGGKVHHPHFMCSFYGHIAQHYQPLLKKGLGLWVDGRLALFLDRTVGIDRVRILVKRAIPYETFPDPTLPERRPSADYQFVVDSVSCEHCGAEKGEPCHFPGRTKPLPKPHVVREQAALSLMGGI